MASREQLLAYYKHTLGFKPAGQPYGVIKARMVAGRLQARMGETAEAQEHWKAAPVLCTHLGERLYAQHIEQCLQALHPPR